VIAVQRSELMVGRAGNVGAQPGFARHRCIFVACRRRDAGSALTEALGTHPLIESTWWSMRRARPAQGRFVSEHHSTHMLRADWEAASAVDAGSEDALIATPSRRCRALARWCCPTMPRAR